MTHIDLDTIRLARGMHSEPECAAGQRCLFEWYNHLTRQLDNDTCPPGVSRVLYAYGMRLNDLLPDDRRQELKRFLPNSRSLLAGTAADGLDRARAWLAADAAVRVFAPTSLDVAGLTELAGKLRALPPVADSLTAADAAADAAAAAYAAADAAAAAAIYDAAIRLYGQMASVTP